MAMIYVDEGRGLFTLEIADAGGELHSYRVAAAAPGLAEWAVRLTRADTDAGYRVRLFGSGLWECECPAFRYRKRKADLCKHCTSMRGVREFLKAMPPVEVRHAAVS